jgi:hypothetical protein
MAEAVQVVIVPGGARPPNHMPIHGDSPVATNHTRRRINVGAEAPPR